MNDEITVLVNSCDGYEDIWDPFFKLFKIYWPECPFRLILNTESKSYNFSGLNIETFQFYEPGKKIPYGERMLRHLKEIKSKYILVLIDDFFFNDYVDENEIVKCMNWMNENEKIAMFSFSPVGDTHNILSKTYIGYERRPNVGVYKVNFQAALWRTSAFIESWKPHESPWEWEKFATYRSFYSGYDYYSRVKGTCNPIDYGARFGEAWNIVAGLWCVESVDENFRKNGIVIDYNQRGILTCDIKSLPRDHQKRTWKDEQIEIKSLGFFTWLYKYCWRLFRKMKQVIGLKVDKDFYEYLYKKLN